MGWHAAFGTGWHALFEARGSGLLASNRHRRIGSDLWRSRRRSESPRDNPVGAGSYFSFLTRLKQAAVNPVITVHAITRKTHPPVVNSAACCSMGSELRGFFIEIGFRGVPAYPNPVSGPCQAFSLRGSHHGTRSTRRTSFRRMIRCCECRSPGLFSLIYETHLSDFLQPRADIPVDLLRTGGRPGDPARKRTPARRCFR